MNKKYICLNEIVSVHNDQNESKVVTYQDNIEEILVSENVIETIEKKIDNINEERAECNKILNKPRWIRFVSNLLPGLLGIVLPLTTIGVAKYLYGPYSNTFLTIEGAATLVMVFTFIPTLTLTISKFLESKNILKKKSALNFQEEMLKEELEKEKNNLENLKKIQDTKNMIKVKTAKVNDKEAIYNLNELSNMYYTWGYSLAKENKEYFE